MQYSKTTIDDGVYCVEYENSSTMRRKTNWTEASKILISFYIHIIWVWNISSVYLYNIINSVVSNLIRTIDK